MNNIHKVDRVSGEWKRQEKEKMFFEAENDLDQYGFNRLRIILTIYNLKLQYM